MLWIRSHTKYAVNNGQLSSMNVLQGLIFEGDGFCLVYKRLSTDSRFQWPRSEDELKEITPQQFKWLMEGLSIAPKKKITELTAPPRYLL